MLSSPVCVPSNSMPLVSPTLALSEARGTYLPACLCCSVSGSAALSVRFGGLEGLEEHNWSQVGLLKGEGAQPVLSAGKGTQTPETLNPSWPLVLTGH